MRDEIPLRTQSQRRRADRDRRRQERQPVRATVAWQDVPNALRDWSTLSRAQQQTAGAKALLAVGTLAAAVVIALVGTGLFEEFVSAPRRPVAVIDGTAVSAETYRRHVAIRQFELARRIASDELQPGLRGSISSPARNELLSLPYNAATELVNAELVRREAEMRGFVPSQEDVYVEMTRYFAEVRENNPGKGQRSDPLVDGTLTKALLGQLDQLRQRSGLQQSEVEPFMAARVREQWLADMLTSDLGSTPGHILANHILVQNETALAEVAKRLAAGEAFEWVARDASIDPNSRNHGGLLGWVPRGLMPEEWDKVAFALPKGEIGKPVQTSQGWHLIRVDNQILSRPLDEGMSERLRVAALQRWVNKALQGVAVQYTLSTEIIEWAQRRTP